MYNFYCNNGCSIIFYKKRIIQNNKYYLFKLFNIIQNNYLKLFKYIVIQNKRILTDFYDFWICYRN